eukprot:TRINITY_DN4453_c0_g1_i1.p1 TRINITY_DN4453_c0_g1~~TRINITY_DN4453_c0_g1_i1.p1  ORF type:complete len:674 (-),score=132.20 TRINITY_DN4453_c0_g1_i1:50-2071(-)
MAAPNPDLQQERSSPSFTVEDLTNLLDGSQTNTQLRRNIRTLIQENPNIQDSSNRIFLSRNQLYEKSLSIVKNIQDVRNTRKFSDVEELFFKNSITEYLPTMLHDDVFIPCIEGQASQEQRDYWLPLARQKKIIGSYAQTELGHGSNVQKLETTATFINETDEIELHSPTISSTKWWSGCLGKTATHTVAFARLIVKGKDLGIHGFIVQLRSMENHDPLSGITLGDIGPKWGTNSMDNGFVRFDRVRIPRHNMLMGFAKLSRDGTYTKPGHAKVGYITMMHVRAFLVLQSAVWLGKALTITIRYSCVRRQFGTPDNLDQERQILDYRTQQYRLFPALAMSYALRFTGEYILGLITEIKQQLLRQDFSLMAEVHATTAGLKSLVTSYTADSIEECRRCCGGHGYQRASGLPDLFVDYLPSQTAEGDNYLLTQQTTRYLLKTIQEIATGTKKPSELPKNVQYLAATPQERWAVSSLEDLLNPALQRAAFEHRARRVITETAQTVAAAASERGFASAWNESLVEIAQCSRAHCLLTIVSIFSEGVSDRVRTQSPALYRPLKNLSDLLALYWIEKEAGDYLIDGFVTGEQIQLIRTQVRKLLVDIRPDAVNLVDAFDFSDEDLRQSVLGRKDGRVYEALLESAMKEPLNKTEAVEPAYSSYLRPLLARSLPSFSAKL